MLKLDVLLTESAMAEGFRAALERRYLPEKYFYWFPLSVQAWLDLCREARPYKNYARSYHLVAKHASDIAAQIRRKAVQLVSLGAGQGDKDLLILKAFRKRGIKAHYRPVDASQSLLEMALRHAEEAGFPSRGLKADVESPQTFRALRSPLGGLAAGAGPRLYLVLGNTLGVMDPVEFLKVLRKLLRLQDRLLVDAEIFSPQATMAGYDNPLNRKFAFAPLASVGLEDGRDGALAFESHNGSIPGLHFVGKYFRAARSLEVVVAGRRMEFQPGERIAANSSSKYSPDVFPKLLRERGGFRPLRVYQSDDGRFLMVLAAPSGTASSV